MSIQQDIPLSFHGSFNDLLDSFRNMIAALTWLKASSTQAQQFYSDYSYVIELDCSVNSQLIKVDKSILKHIEDEGFNGDTPLFTKTLINFYRVLTIAVKDIIWEEADFNSLLQKDELQFLRHVRNASAHENKFFFGKGKQRSNTLAKLPLTWRNKTISEATEGTQLYMDFMSPGDLFYLLSDISNLVSNGNS